MSTDTGCKFDTFYVFEQEDRVTTVWACCTESDVTKTCGYLSARVVCGTQTADVPTAEWSLLDQLNTEHHRWAEEVTGLVRGRADD